MRRNSIPITNVTRGFTLIEVLVAITILAIIAVMGWRGLDSIIRARGTLNSELEQSRGAQISFAQLENDCAHLASVTLLPNRERVRAFQQQLVLIRTVYDDHQPSRLQVVAYRMQEGVFSRRESRATRDLHEIEAYWQNAISGSDAMPIVPLQTDVISFEMRTWSSNETSWRVAGSDSPITSGQVKPEKVGLEITMQLRGREHPLIKIFLLGAA
jgi:general secretion pathway protein J